MSIGLRQVLVNMTKSEKNLKNLFNYPTKIRIPQTDKQTNRQTPKIYTLSHLVDFGIEKVPVINEIIRAK